MTGWRCDYAAKSSIAVTRPRMGDPQMSDHFAYHGDELFVIQHRPLFQFLAVWPFICAANSLFV